MKRIFTLLLMGMLCLCSKSSFAQFSQNFDDINTINGNCYGFEGFFLTMTPTEVITGAGSLYTNPPTGNNTRDMFTPYLNFTSTNINISFNYKLSEDIKNGSRVIEVGVLYTDNTYSIIETVNVTQLVKTTYNKNVTIPKTGVGRLAFKFSGQGVGTCRFIVDDLSTSASPRYGTGTCNKAPLLTPDTYNAQSYAPYVSTRSVLTNDTEPDGESMIVSFVSCNDGTVTFNADGTFTFTPKSGFTGASATFTYRVTDNGYDVASSTSTVTIFFPANGAIILPIHLKSLSGNVNNSKAQLSWNVADNETGSYFEIQKSVDGKKFENVAMLFTTAKVGDETYTYSEATTLKEGAFYRLRVVNKDNSVSYSKVIYLKALDATDTNKIMLLQNPVQSTLSFAFTTAVSEPTEIAVYNMAGVKVYSQKTMAQKGTNTINTDCNNKLTTGNYILQVSSASNNATTKIVKY